MNRRALIVVDPQKDFMPGGSLAVAGGDEIVAEINRMLGGLDPSKQWDLVVATKDDHPANHCSFVTQPTGKWPVHCVHGTKGAEFHGNIYWPSSSKCSFTVVRKGDEAMVDSYSAFFDNTKGHKTELDGILRDQRIDEIFVCGLATDVCVKATVLDALDLRIPTTVLIDACRAVNIHPGDERKALVEMARAGAKLTVVDKIFR